MLKRILLGNQPCDLDDRTLTSAALRTLIEHRDAQNERILLAVLTVPDSIRPPGRGQMTADQLHEECLRQMRPIATTDFRLQLAQRVAHGVSSSASRQRLLSLLSSSDRQNLPAQVELSVSGHVESGVQSTLDRQLGQTCQQVLERLLRATSVEWNGAKNGSVTARAGVNENLSRELPFPEIMETLAHLWRLDFAQTLAERIATAADTPTDTALLTLAMSLPSDTVRAALFRRWKDAWVEESSVATSPTLYNGPRDPGLVAVLKQLPREAPAANLRVASMRQYSDTPQGQRMAKEQAAKKAWLCASENLVRALTDRCRQIAESQDSAAAVTIATTPVGSVADFDKLLDSATQSQSPAEATARSDSSDSVTANCGLKLHKGARVKAAYHLNWPADFQGHLSGSTPGPLAICYLRLESESELELVASYYCKQLKLALVRTIDNGRWIDALTKLDSQRIRSTDVLITRVDKDPEVPRRGVAEKLVIDVLCIEVADPASDNRTSVPLNQVN